MTYNYFVKNSPVDDFWGNIGPVRASIHIGMCAIYGTCILLFDNTVELNNVHQSSGDRYQVDGNPRFRPWCQPTMQIDAVISTTEFGAG